jgi:hypothetical protein
MEEVMEIYKASNQWMKRPADERFWTLQEMLNATHAYYKEAVQSTVNYADLRAEAEEGDIFLTGRSGQHARLTHWSFGQLAQRAGAPAGYLRKLPATLAVQNVNHGLKERGKDDTDQARLLLHINGDLVLRGMTGMDYSRIWNFEVADRLMQLPGNWRTPPAYANTHMDPRARPAVPADLMPGVSYITAGSMIGPSGIYASSHDMFVFLVDPDHPIEVDGTVLYPFALFWNSEVGAKSIGGMSGLLNAVCGNHIIWGAKYVREFRFRHVGKARDRAFQKLGVEMKEYANESTHERVALIKSAKSFVLGATKEEILDTIFGYASKKKLGVGRQILEQAYDVAVEREDRYGDPNTAWAVSNGMSELSQSISGGFTDRRVELDRAAGKLMEIAF